MNRMTWRILRTELIRGSAPVASLGIVLAGLVVMSAMAGGWAGWAGRWIPLASTVRFSLLALGAFTVAAAAWQAGRSRRRRMTDQLESTPRPNWQAPVVSWAAVTLGSMVGLAAVVTVCAALVAPVASDDGRGWRWMVAAAFTGILTFSAIGTLVGRLLPARITAPVAAVTVYLAMTAVVDGGTGPGLITWLTPVLSPYDAPGSTVDALVSSAQMVWFTAAAATALVLATARRPWLALVPAGAAAGAIVWLASLSPGWRPDPVALELVCTEEGAPEVCTTTLNAFLLDGVVAETRGLLTHWEGVEGGPAVAVDQTAWVGARPEQRGGEVRLNLSGGATLSGQFVPPPAASDTGPDLIDWWPQTTCDADAVERHWDVSEIAAAWGNRAHAWLPPRTQGRLETLLTMTENDQKDWIERFLTASEACDEQGLVELDEELT